jgi:hypothetical protein
VTFFVIYSDFLIISLTVFVNNRRLENESDVKTSLSGRPRVAFARSRDYQIALDFAYEIALSKSRNNASCIKQNSRRAVRAAAVR